MLKECFEFFASENNLKDVNIGYGYDAMNLIENYPNTDSISISINQVIPITFEAGQVRSKYICSLVLVSNDALNLIPKLYEYTEKVLVVEEVRKGYFWTYDSFSFFPNRDENKLTAFTRLEFYV